MMADKEQSKESDGKGGGGSKMVLVLLIAVIVAAAGGVGAYFALSQKTASAEPPVTKALGPLMPLKGFIVNLDEPGGTRYLKMSVSLELNRQPTKDAPNLDIRLRDQVIVYLSGLRIAMTQRPKAKLEIKKKLIELANKVYGESTVREVYFTEFVIQ